MRYVLVLISLLALLAGVDPLGQHLAALAWSRSTHDGVPSETNLPVTGARSAGGRCQWVASSNTCPCRAGRPRTKKETRGRAAAAASGASEKAAR